MATISKRDSGTSGGHEVGIISGQITLRNGNEAKANERLFEIASEWLPKFGNDWNAHSNVLMRRQTMSRILYYNHLYQQMLDVPGVVCELGCQWGSTLSIITNLRGIYEPYNYTRDIIGFDTFSGFPTVAPQDGGYSNVGDFATDEGYPAVLRQILGIHEANCPLPHIKKHDLIVGDVAETFPKWIDDNPHAILSMIIFDMDIYTPTKVALKAALPRLTKGSILVFDELNTRHFPGETRALDEVVGLGKLRLQRHPQAPTQAWAVWEG